MAAIELISSFLQRATAQGSRSTAVNPLLWVFGIILSALLIAIRVPDAPSWLLGSLGASAGILLIAFLIAYFFLLFRDRDALRSERFTLSKMAIERSVNDPASAQGIGIVNKSLDEYLAARGREHDILVSIDPPSA
jgi:hypothetical protein